MAILGGCSNELKDAKKNADAGMYMYEESQELDGDDKVEAGLKWLFGILDETDLPQKQMDNELRDKRNNVLNLLSEKYMMTDEEIKEISSIKEDDSRNAKIDSIYKPIAEKLAKKQDLEEWKQQRERLKQVANMDPTIGMTKKEVEASLWGTPDSINTTVTAHVKSEQWVYDGYRYVYFDDGIVTSISY
ncbi:hypothetical protein J23TS9_06310 [Paenibacillus sp. J23TS9]|uniref:hypothetical protein n=1 Tax=Paenibacillus sp. J23TS9 TaxID=2807193 RepID=UPI001B211628|nr:hypothetical protein [Paenibacillus sp. J23TS9]GIP25501.1 hypothetical protein J23TS9_06310 [Paenibacillus sp. J23TS9]